MPLQDAPQLRAQLLGWFQSQRRDLPWRQPRTLYGTWIAEIMLQQTTVATVIPYFHRFLQEFPHVQALAAAPEEKVLALWTGLGYYRRARHLHAAARRIVSDLGGRLPEDAEGWRRLPGIGEYAAGAIASQALGQQVPAVDANARRVLTRWSCGDPALAEQMKPGKIHALAAELVPRQDPGTWNEALMELGAMVCRARDPRCAQCPVLDFCAAGLAGRAREIPPPRRPAAAQPVLLATLVLRQAGRVLLTGPEAPLLLCLEGDPPRARRDTDGLHQGLRALPMTPWYADLPATNTRLADANQARRWVARFLRTPRPDPAWRVVDAGSFAHAITRYRLRVRVWGVDLPPDDPAPTPAGAVWTAKPEDHPLSHLVTKSLSLKALKS